MVHPASVAPVLLGIIFGSVRDGQPRTNEIIFFSNFGSPGVANPGRARVGREIVKYYFFEATPNE